MSAVKKITTPCSPGDVLFLDWGSSIREGVVKRVIAFMDENRSDFRVEIRVSVEDPIYAGGKSVDYNIIASLEPCGSVPVAYFTKTEALAARNPDAPARRLTEEETSYDFDDDEV